MQIRKVCGKLLTGITPMHQEESSGDYLRPAKGRLHADSHHSEAGRATPGLSGDRLRPVPSDCTGRTDANSAQEDCGLEERSQGQESRQP